MMRARCTSVLAMLLVVLGVTVAAGCLFPPPSSTSTVTSPPPPQQTYVAPTPAPAPVAPAAPFAQATGTISYPGETVQYPLTVDYTRTISIYVQGYGLDPTVRVFDSYGNQMGYNDDGGSGLDSQLALTLVPGSYVVEVAGFGGSTGGFSVTAQ